MTTQGIIDRLEQTLHAEKYWRRQDEGSGKSAEGVYIAAHRFLQSSIESLVAELKAGR